jgi:hypothetical protein
LEPCSLCPVFDRPELSGANGMSNTSRFVRSRMGRTIWLVLVSPVVCTGVACLVGATLGAVSLIACRLASPLEAARGLPSGMLYSLIAAGPLGLAGGVLGALLAAALGGGVLRAAPRRRWLVAGLSTGAVVGLVGALFFVMTGAGDRSLIPVTLFALMCVLAGSAEGAIVAFLGWREFGDSTVNG